MKETTLNISCHTPNFLFWVPRNGRIGKEWQADCTYRMEDWGFSGAMLQTRLGGMEGSRNDERLRFRRQRQRCFRPPCGCRTQSLLCDGIRSGAVRKKRKRTENSGTMTGTKGAQQSSQERHHGICSLWRNSGKRNLEAQRLGSGHPGVWRRRCGPHESLARSRSRTLRNNSRTWREKKRDNVRWKKADQSFLNHGDERKQTNHFWTMARDALAQVVECERRRRRKEYDGDVEECTETVEVACSAHGGLYFRRKRVPGKALWSGDCCCSEHGMSPQKERESQLGRWQRPLDVPTHAWYFVENRNQSTQNAEPHSMFCSMSDKHQQIPVTARSRRTHSLESCWNSRRMAAWSEAAACASCVDCPAHGLWHASSSSWLTTFKDGRKT